MENCEVMFRCCRWWSYVKGTKDVEKANSHRHVSVVTNSQLSQISFPIIL